MAIGFFNDVDKVFRGLKHTLKFKRNDVNNVIHKAAEVALGKFVITDMSWWIPAAKPNVMTELRLNKALSKGVESLVYWEDMAVYRSDPRNEIDVRWRVSSMGKKPSHIYVMLQTVNKGNDQNSNNMIFDHMNLKKARVWINSTPFPRKEFDSDFADRRNDYQRLYYSFLEAGMKTLDFDTGTQVNYTDYKNLYPILHFDVSKHDDKLYETVTTAEIVVELHLALVPASRYYIYCVIACERYMKLQGVMNKINVVL
jgi:hypothetical protein